MSVGAIRAGRAMVEIFADSSMLSRGLATAQGKMARFASTLRRLGTAQVVVGAAFAAPLAAAVSTYAQLEKRINTVRALTGATARQMAGLTDQIRRIGHSTGMAFTEIADAMGELARAGVKLKDLGAATRVVADFSRAAGIDMARAANIGVEILTQFGLSMEHLPRVADVLQEMANATVSTVEELSDGFRYAGQAASMFGLSLEETAAAIAYLQQSGLSASTAGTSLNQMLLQVVQNMDKLEGAIGGLRDADGEFLPFEQVLRKLQQHLKAMPGPERMQFLNEMFDVRGMRGAHALLKNIEAWLQLTAQAQASTGATARKAAEMAKAFIVAFEKMRNGVSAFGYAIGEALDSDLRSAFSAIGNVAITLAEFVKKNQEIVQIVGRTAAALVASGAAFFTLGLSIQLALFSLEGFLKVASGVAGVVLAPFRMVTGAAGMLLTAIGRVGGLMGWLGGIAVGLARGAFGQLRTAFVALGTVIAGPMRVAAQASTVIVAMSAAAVRASWAMLDAMANVPGTVFRVIDVLREMGSIVAEVFMAGVGVVAQFGAAFITAAPALLTAAGAIATVAAGVVAIGVAAKVAQVVWRGLTATLEAIGKGLPKIWEGFVSRSKEVWPEMVATAKAGWAGITAALQSGDIGLAWRIFVQSAHAAFAQVMIIIGPAVDDAAEILGDIGTGLYRGIEWAVRAAGDLLWGLREITRPLFDWLAGAGEWFISGFDGASGLFGRLGDYAEEGGNRIYEALSAGDIVAAWAAAMTAIRKMIIDVGSLWESSVAAPVRLMSEDFMNQGVHREMRDRAERTGGRLLRDRVGQILAAPTPQHLETAHGRAAEARNWSDDERAQIDQARRQREAEFRAAGVMTDEQREAERQRQQQQADEDFRRGEEDRARRREEKQKERRAAADNAAARAASSASTAQEAQRNREIEQGIDAATTPEDFETQQAAIDARREDRKKAEADVGIDPGDVRSERRKLEHFKQGQLDLIQMRRNVLADAVGSGDITEEQANVYSAQLDAAEAATSAAASIEQVEGAWADLNGAVADAVEGLGEDARGPGAHGLRGADEFRLDQEVAEGAAEGGRNELDAAQAADNAAREKESRRLRREAAEARRAGDEAVAAEKERQADALDQALDQQEEAELQSRLDRRREEMDRQRGLREQAGRNGKAGERAAQDKRLDAVGGFMNSAFDRLGFGTNLAERQAKAAEDTARGVNALVGMARNGGGVFIG